jgi:hypothetical protein
MVALGCFALSLTLLPQCHDHPQEKDYRRCCRKIPH